MRQAERLERLRLLHEGPDLLPMPNGWDALSARMLAGAGFPSLGSSSAALAWSVGKEDGARKVCREDAIDHAVLLGEASGLPVNGDLEGGFGDAPGDCAATVEASVSHGLAGLSIEDTTADPARPIHHFDRAVGRMCAPAASAKDARNSPAGLTCFFEPQATSTRRSGGCGPRRGRSRRPVCARAAASGAGRGRRSSLVDEAGQRALVA